MARFLFHSIEVSFQVSKFFSEQKWLWRLRTRFEIETKPPFLAFSSTFVTTNERKNEMFPNCFISKWEKTATNVSMTFKIKPYASEPKCLKYQIPWKKDKKNSFLASPGNGSGRLRVRVPIEFVVDRFFVGHCLERLNFWFALKPGCGLAVS